VDDDFEMIALEEQGTDPKYTWEIIAIYRAANEDTFFTYAKLNKAKHYIQ
jgi:hypothetical protein